ncbi:TPA: hypothetical protein ACU8BO_000063 [Neisseria subflava]
MRFPFIMRRAVLFSDGLCLLRGRLKSTSWRKPRFQTASLSAWFI